MLIVDTFISFIDLAAKSFHTPITIIRFKYYKYEY